MNSEVVMISTVLAAHELHPGRHWQMLEDGRVQCDICPRECKLREGQRGMCFVRARHDDSIVLTTYGRSSGFCIDPIEKKPLNHFLPGTPVLSFGTAGCNLACKFCQNWSISKSREMDILTDAASPEQLADTCVKLGCRSAAFTYNDPVVFHEYAIDIAKACRERGIKTVAVTAGYHSPQARAEFYQHMDAANVDLKAFTQDFYHNICAGELAAVLDTLRYLKLETEVWLEITTLLIPGENDSDDEVDALSKWIFNELGADVPLHFSAFHPDFRMLNKSRTPPHCPPAYMGGGGDVLQGEMLRWRQVIGGIIPYAIRCDGFHRRSGRQDGAEGAEQHEQREGSRQQRACSHGAASSVLKDRLFPFIQALIRARSGPTGS